MFYINNYKAYLFSPNKRYFIIYNTSVGIKEPKKSSFANFTPLLRGDEEHRYLPEI
jgi:hypothetical protein